MAELRIDLLESIEDRNVEEMRDILDDRKKALESIANNKKSKGSKGDI